MMTEEGAAQVEQAVEEQTFFNVLLFDKYDLNEVSGIEHFPQDPALRVLLASNGFAVVPRPHRQIFSPYLFENDLPYLPPFVTVDSLVRTYEVILREALRVLERAQAPRLLAISERLLERLRAIETG